MNGDFDNFALGALFNLLSAVIIVRFVYYQWTQNRSYTFTFLAFSMMVYFVMSMLTSIELSVGVGFGLFAIFSVIRYRTEEMPIRETTYLFIIIALPVINSVLARGDEEAKVLTANAVMVVLLYVLEREWGFHFEAKKRIAYDRVDLVTPAQYAALVADLRERTGIEIHRAEVGRIDFVRDTAEVTIYFDPPNHGLSARRAGLGGEFEPAGKQIFDRE